MDPSFVDATQRDLKAIREASLRILQRDPSNGPGLLKLHLISTLYGPTRTYAGTHPLASHSFDLGKTNEQAGSQDSVDGSEESHAANGTPSNGQPEERVSDVDMIDVTRSDSQPSTSSDSQTTTTTGLDSETTAPTPSDIGSVVGDTRNGKKFKGSLNGKRASMSAKRQIGLLEIPDWKWEDWL